MDALKIPVFADSKATDSEPQTMRPERILNPRRPHTWSLTPKTQLGDQACAHLIDILRKRGSNAIIINEDGVLEFGEVVRHDAAHGESKESK